MSPNSALNEIRAADVGPMRAHGDECDQVLAVFSEHRRVHGDVVEVLTAGLGIVGNKGIARTDRFDRMRFENRFERSADIRQKDR